MSLACTNAGCHNESFASVFFILQFSKMQTVENARSLVTKSLESCRVGFKSVSKAGCSVFYRSKMHCSQKHSASDHTIEENVKVI